MQRCAAHMQLHEESVISMGLHCTFTMSGLRLPGLQHER